MSRRNRKAKGKGDNLPPFKPLFNYVWKSPAWKALTPVERCVYLEIKFRYLGDNNGSIAMSTREIGDAIGKSKSTAARALQRLEELGFILTEVPSGFSRKDRIAAEYRLTEYPDDLPGRSKIPTKEFVGWRCEEKTTVAKTSVTVPPVQPSRSKRPEKPLHSPTGATVRAEDQDSTVAPVGHYLDIPPGGGVEAAPRAQAAPQEPLPHTPELAAMLKDTQSRGERAYPQTRNVRRGGTEPSADAEVEPKHTGAATSSFPEPCDASTLTDLGGEERVLLRWLVGFGEPATHRKAQQNLSGLLKGEDIRRAAVALESRKLVQIKNTGRSVIYAVLDAKRASGLLGDQDQTDLESWLERT